LCNLEHSFILGIDPKRTARQLVMESKDLPSDIPRHRDAGELLALVLTRRFRRYTKLSSGPTKMSHQKKDPKRSQNSAPVIALIKVVALCV
jgi:hypothetical protein